MFVILNIFYKSISFQGFESILEGLLGPELLEGLKLFKGKNLFYYDTSSHDHTCI